MCNFYPITTLSLYDISDGAQVTVPEEQVMKAKYLVLVNVVNGKDVPVTAYFNNKLGKAMAAEMLAAYGSTARLVLA